MIYRLILFFILLFFIACEKTSPTIEVVDFNKFNMVGVPVKQQKELSKLLYQLIELKTENHLVPAINLQRTNGEEIELKKLLNSRKCILLFANSTCPACEIAYHKNFPNIRDSLKKSGIEYRFIPIIVQYDHDIEKADRFRNKINDLKSFYPEVYIISDSIAGQFNVYGYPVQIYLNENGIVKEYNMGASIDVNQTKMAEVIKFFKP